MRLRTATLVVAMALSLGAKATRPPEVLEESALGAKDRAQGIALIETYLKERHDPVERAWAMLWRASSAASRATTRKPHVVRHAAR